MSRRYRAVSDLGDCGCTCGTSHSHRCCARFSCHAGSAGNGLCADRWRYSLRLHMSRRPARASGNGCLSICCASGRRLPHLRASLIRGTSSIFLRGCLLVARLCGTALIGCTLRSGLLRSSLLCAGLLVRRLLRCALLRITACSSAAAAPTNRTAHSGASGAAGRRTGRSAFSGSACALANSLGNLGGSGANHHIGQCAGEYASQGVTSHGGV